MNFARDVVDAAPGGDRALVEIDAAGARREWTFAEVSDASARLAGTFVARGVRRGDVVMTLIGSRPQWVLSMVACFRIGAVALPCNEQLRAKDLRMRIDAAAPRLIVCDERNAGELSTALQGIADAPLVILIPDPSLLDSEPAPAVELAPTDPCLITFTSGTTGTAKGIIHGQRYLPGQLLQASTWLGAQRGDLVWCTAASGWSKSARNAFIAPWLQGAAALLHDARFDPEQRLASAGVRAGQRALHGADRVPRDRQARDARAGAVAARPGRGRRGAQPRGPAGVRGRDGVADP